MPTRPRPFQLLTVLATASLVFGAAGVARATEEPTPVEEPGADAPTEDPEAYLQVVDLTFPTDPSVWFGDDYAAPRGGGSRVHKATDLIGEKLLPLYAAVDGTVCYITGVDAPMPSWGYSLTICDDEGRSYHYLHINNDRPGTDDGQGGLEWAYAPDVRRGATVTRGQFVGYMGDSGNAEWTADHLHFEIRDDTVTDPYGDHRINPYPSLVAALDRGDVSDAPVPTPVHTDRIGGTDRIGTAIALSASAFEQADGVLIAPSSSPAEAIVAGPLAASLGVPVLTMHPDVLDERVVAEVQRLGATRLTIVGDVLVGRQLADLLEATGISGDDVTVLRGRDVFATAARVAERVLAVAGEAGERRALVALGEHADPGRSWPDSLMASYAGAATGRPVLLVRGNELPPATANVLAHVDQVTIIGGSAAVSERVADQIRGLGIEVARQYGATRYSTAVAVAGSLLDAGVVTAERVWGATGRNWPDAVTSGPVVARLGQLLVLVDGADEGGDAEVHEWLSTHATGAVSAVAVGGTRAVADGALGRLAQGVR